MVQETDIVTIDEHLKVHEAIIPGPHGPQVMILSIEDDVHIQEEIKKNEKEIQGSHVRSTQDFPQALDMEASTSESSQHHLMHNHKQQSQS